MNLGQAAAVCLYEVARSPGTAKNTRPAPAGKIALASAREQERVTTLWLENLRLSGYLATEPRPGADEKIRRLVRRLRLSASDAELLAGMFRQIAWKIKEIG
jgi:tRNA/rRNA methyltransferase